MSTRIRGTRNRVLMGAGISLALTAGLLIAVPGSAQSDPPTYTIQGRVVTDDGLGGLVGVATVPVSAHMANGQNWFGQSMTQGDGTFTMNVSWDNNQGTIVPLRIFVAAPESGTLGSELFPNRVQFVESGNPQTVNVGDLTLKAANVVGTVATASGTPPLSGDVVGASAGVLNGQNLEDTSIPLRITSNGTFRSFIDPAEAPDGIELRAEPAWWDPNVTLDDTWLAGKTRVNNLPALGSPAVTANVVLPPSTFWGRLLDAQNQPYGGGNVYIRGSIGSGDSAVPIDMVRVDSQGYFRMYIDRSLTGDGSDDSPVTFSWSVNWSGWQSRTYVLADADGDSSDNAMDVQPPPPNLAVTVFRDDSTNGPREVGANVSINVPNSYDGYIGGGETDSNGEVRVYANNPGNAVWVQVTDVTAGYAEFAGQLTPIDSDQDGVFEVTVTLRQPNYRVTVLKQGEGPDVGAQVNVSLGQTSLLSGQTGVQGQVLGWVPDPTALMYTNVNPSPNAQSEGFTSVGREGTATDPDGDGVYDDTVTLRQANLTILVRANGDFVPNAGVQLSTDNNAQWLGYQFTDSNGEADFAVDDPNRAYMVQVNQLPDDVSDAGFASFNGRIPPSQGSDERVYVVDLQEANVYIRVRDEMGNDVPNAFVWLNPCNSPQGYNGNADVSGYVKLFVDPDAVNIDGPMCISVSPPWDRRPEFAGNQYQNQELQFLEEEGVWYFEATLLTPNARFRVVKPGTNVAMPWANLEFRQPNDWMSTAWGNSDQEGNASVSLPDGVFDLFVDPPWNSQDDTIYARTKYSITVDGGEVASVMTPGDDTVVPDNQGRYRVSPLPAIYSATVKVPGSGDPSPYTWVEVMKETDGWLEYVSGASTNLNGRFGLMLKDDSYVLRARAPWGVSGLAPSADCSLVIRDQEVAEESTCGSELLLRTPNLRLTLVDPQDQPQAGGWACVGREFDWKWTCEGSAGDGVVALLIDDTSSMLGDLIVEANPPYGSEDLSMARETIPTSAFAGLQTLDETIVLPAPNVRIQVSLDDDTRSAMWSWVSVVEVDDTNWTWIAGGPANQNGIVNLNLDDTSGTYCVGVYPPWEQRSDFAPVEECGVSLSSGNHAVDLLPANVFTTVVDAEGRKNAWGWAEYSQRGGTLQRGTGLDEKGRFVAALPRGFTYDVTFYPGWQRVGSPTTVTVTVSATGVVTIPDPVQLSSGNVSGRVTQPGAPNESGLPYEGVIVIAYDGTRTVSAVTDSEGKFRMQLPAGIWDVTLIEPESAVPTVTFNGGLAYANGELVVP